MEKEKPKAPVRKPVKFGLYTVDIYNGKNIISSVTVEARDEDVAKLLTIQKLKLKISRYRKVIKTLKNFR